VKPCGKGCDPMTVKRVVAAGLLLVVGPGLAPGRVAHAAELDCLIRPRETVSVSPPVDGIVDQVRVDRGDLVEKGTVLAVLESSLEGHAVAIARARAEQDYAINSNQVRMEFGARRFERTDVLYKQNLIPLKEFDEAQTAKLIAEYELVGAKENKRLADLEYERAKAALDLKTIRSPLSGVVVERLRYTGELAAKDNPIVKIAQLNPLRVEVVSPIALLGKVAVGQRAVVIPEVPMNRPLKASVTVVDKVVDAASSTFTIRMEVPNPDNRIPSGLKCKVRLGGNSP